MKTYVATSVKNININLSGFMIRLFLAIYNINFFETDYTVDWTG
jgi:hypothetical protein